MAQRMKTLHRYDKLKIFPNKFDRYEIPKGETAEQEMASTRDNAKKSGPTERKLNIDK